MLSNATNQLQNENEAADFIDELIQIKRNDNMIHYITDAATKIEKGDETVSYNDVNQLISRIDSFFEVLNPSNKFIHPPFDFDGFDKTKKSCQSHPEKFIKNIDDYDFTINWLNSLKPRFKEYSIAGYTNDEELSKKTGLLLKPNAEKYVSLHVIFYQVIVDANCFKQWITQLIQTNEMPFLDDEVYKFTTGRQLFRHALTNKLIAGKRDFTQIITPRGDESFVELELSEPFSNKKEKHSDTPIPSTHSDETDIIMNYAELKTLLSNIKTDELDTTQELANKVSGNLANAAHVFNDIDKLCEIVDEWYNDSGEYEHEHEHYASNILKSKYGKSVGGNMWFYGLLKLVMSQTVRDKYMKKYVQQVEEDEVADFLSPQQEENILMIRTDDIEFGSSDFEQISKNDFDYTQALRFLKGCVGVYHADWYVKEGKYDIRMLKTEDFRKEFSLVHPIKGNNKSAYDIVMKNSDKFIYHRVNVLKTPDSIHLYIPPALTVYNKQFIDAFTQCYFNRVEHHTPLRYFFDSIAYTVRNNLRLIQNYFVFYGEGDDGKTYILKILKKMFRNFMRIGEQTQFTQDKFNSWKDNTIIRWIEEAQNDYITKDLETHIKITTGEDESRRAMCKALTDGKNTGLEGMNTNKQDLCGLVSSGDACKKRLVIVEFKQRNAELAKEIDDMSKLFEADEENNLASLWVYFKEKHVIDEHFSPVARYNGKEKWDYIESHKPINSVVRWIDENKDRTLDVVKKIKKVEHYAISISAGNLSYKRYCREERLSNFNKNDWKDVMVKEMGGKQIHNREGDFIVIEKAKLDEMLNKLIPQQKIEFDDPADEEEEEETAEEEFNANKWIISHTFTKNAASCILAQDIRDELDKQKQDEVVDILENDGWKFTTALFKEYRKRGYKKYL